VLGATIAYVTHGGSKRWPDKIVLLNAGRIEQQRMKTYMHPGTLFAARFIGSPKSVEVTVK
jgi:ABC-type sugar transport system ATPase subunit